MRERRAYFSGGISESFFILFCMLKLDFCKIEVCVLEDDFLIWANYIFNNKVNLPFDEVFSTLQSKKKIRIFRCKFHRKRHWTVSMKRL